MMVTLTPEELKEAEELAHARNDCKTHLNSKVWVKKGTSSFDNHYFGLKCEMAVAKVLGIEINREIYGLKGDQQAPDLVFEGIGVEVKGRGRAGWDFALTKNDPNLFKSDVGVLCWPGENDAEIDVVGFVTKQKFLDCSIVKDYKYGPRLVCEKQHMTPLTRENLLKKPEAHTEINPTKGAHTELGKMLAPIIKLAAKEGSINWTEIIQLAGSGLRCRVSVESLQ